jgi:hypothetical protein
VEGASVWRDDGTFTPVTACSGGWDAAECSRFTGESAKARLQVQLERGFATFEARWTAVP